MLHMKMTSTCVEDTVVHVTVEELCCLRNSRGIFRVNFIGWLESSVAPLLCVSILVRSRPLKRFSLLLGPVREIFLILSVKKTSELICVVAKP